jgi:hypothetical protein
VRFVHLKKSKHIHKRPIHPLVREDVTIANGSCLKNSGHEQGVAWLDDEIISGKPAVVNDCDFDCLTESF